MPRKKRMKDENKTPEMLRLEKEGAATLKSWTEEQRGRAAELARRSGILAPIISRMANSVSPISMEDAMLLEVASDRALRAEVLCPAMAETLRAFRGGR